MSLEAFGLDAHATFVLASYLICFIVLAGLIASIRLDGARQRKLLDQLEAQGIKTRRESDSNRQRDTK